MKMQRKAFSTKTICCAIGSFFRICLFIAAYCIVHLAERFFQARMRACLKNNSYRLHNDAKASYSPLCVIFAPNSVDVRHCPLCICLLRHFYLAQISHKLWHTSDRKVFSGTLWDFVLRCELWICKLREKAQWSGASSDGTWLWHHEVVMYGLMLVTGSRGSDCYEFVVCHERSYLWKNQVISFQPKWRILSCIII